MARSSQSLPTLDASELCVDDLVALADTTAAQRVSLYQPTHVAGRDVTQDPIRMRRLIELAASEVDHDAMLDPVRELVDDHEFWAHGSPGLGVLIHPEQTRVLRLPGPVAELVVVSDRFHLKPLLPTVNRVSTLEVLALSRHAVRLVRVAGVVAHEVEVPGLPAGMRDALREDDRERQLQSHAAGRVGSGRVTAAFHGQGRSNEPQDADLDRFLRMVDRAVTTYRADSRTPLVLAGVDEIVAAYRAITRCRHVVAAHLSGSPDRTPVGDLADRAGQLLPPDASGREQRARESFLQHASATVDSVEQAVIAAAAGQVDSVFVPIDREHWGRHRHGHALLVEHDERGPGDHDLADVAATETIRHGGAAFAVPADEIPGGGTAAATLRF